MPSDVPTGAGGADPFRPRSPLVIGLVGGIGAGKSTVAGLLAARGLRHVDADAHAHAVTRDPAVLAEIREDLGERFVRDGALDRAAVAAHVFADPGAKARLEAIVHPRVRGRIVAELAEARAGGESTLLDVPLLFEAGLFEACDVVVFVDAPDVIRAERTRARGWADDELGRREQNQMPVAEKRARADHVLDNGGDLAATARQVDALLRRLEVG